MNYILPLALLVSGAVTAASDHPWYAGARLGDAHFSDFANNNQHPENQDQNDLAGGIFLGYNYKAWFAVEADYTYLGEAEFGNNNSVEQQGVDIVSKFTW